MATMLDRLRAYLEAPATMQLAQVAPLGVLAGASAAVIAAVIGLPTFATSGLGIIFGGLAVNFTSSLIDKIIHGGERERPQLIQQGLKAGDDDVQRLVAGALAHAGPELAAALPHAERDELIDAIEQGMRAAGGPLAAIAGGYTAALRSPGANWAALQAALHPAIQAVRQEIRAEQLAQDVRQEAHDVDGAVHQFVAAETVSGATQIAAGVRKPRPVASSPARPCPDCGAALMPGAATCLACGLPLT